MLSEKEEPNKHQLEGKKTQQIWSASNMILANNSADEVRIELCPEDMNCAEIESDNSSDIDNNNIIIVDDVVQVEGGANTSTSLQASPDCEAATDVVTRLQDVSTEDLAMSFNVSKILIPAAFGAITWAAGDVKEKLDTTAEWVLPVAVGILWISIILMVVGFYLQAKPSNHFMLFERSGHTLCIAGIMLLQAPVIMTRIPAEFLFIPTVVVATVVAGAIFFAGKGN